MEISMSQVVPSESFNPDPDARYHRSLLDAFPVRDSYQLIQLRSTRSRSPFRRFAKACIRAVRALVQ
ncbi:MAG TPA: hypothetical protein DEH65_18055 [Delftia acidovorans]|nr:hypothetical protein [Delftia sp.]HBY36848.1 hypothetical protein [Delftia acidovorans]